jgi:sugar-specific transcriptional regulator TrmB
MNELPAKSRFTESDDLFDNLALRAEVVILKKLLDDCQKQLKMMKTVVATLDKQLQSSEEGQNIMKGYMDNIYKRIECIEKTTELIENNDAVYNAIVKKVEISVPRGVNRIILPSIDEVFSENIKIGNKD